MLWKDVFTRTLTGPGKVALDKVQILSVFKETGNPLTETMTTGLIGIVDVHPTQKLGFRE
jgi:hypothetical protein